MSPSPPNTDKAIPAEVAPGTLDEASAVKALEVLGYSHGEAEELVAVAAGWDDVEEVE